MFYTIAYLTISPKCVPCKDGSYDIVNHPVTKVMMVLDLFVGAGLLVGSRFVVAHADLFLGSGAVYTTLSLLNIARSAKNKYLPGKFLCGRMVMQSFRKQKTEKTEAPKKEAKPQATLFKPWTRTLHAKQLDQIFADVTSSSSDEEN